MLISCFQCRQQLDVPEDSAGKRVRCPHCQYVIVVPSKSKPAQADTEGNSPAMAMPAMDLDVEGDKATPTTKISPLPMPPMDLPPRETSKPEPKGAKPIDELPEMPSIDRGTSRRSRMGQAPPSKVKWGRILGIGAVIGVIVVGIIAGMASSRNNRHRVHMPPPNPQQFQMHQNRPGQPLHQQLAMNWMEFQSPDRRFKVQFPGNGNPQQPGARNLNGVAMNFFLMPMGLWEFSVYQRTMTDDEFKKPLEPRFVGVEQGVRDILNANFNQQFDPFLNGIHPGRQWEYILHNQNQWASARTYFVRDGAKCYHYVLIARGPFGAEADKNRFFDSFNVMLDPTNGQTILEEFDALNLGARRDNEFTALALHPKRSIVVTGSITSQLKIASEQNNNPPNPFGFPVREGKSVEQISVSPDGNWLAVAVAGEIEYWQNWADDAPQNKAAMPGLRCAFTKDNRLLVATKNDVQEFEVNQPHNRISTLAVPGLAVKGFALSPDEQTLVVFGDMSIAFYQWKEKKLLGKIEAHEAAVTAVAFAPDGKTLASASVDRTIKLWNVGTRTERATLKQHAWTVWALAFKPDGKYLASGGLDGMLLMWDVQPMQPQLLWAQAHQFPVRCVAFDADGKHLYATCKHPADMNQAGGRQFVRQVRKIPWGDMKPNTAEAQRVVAQKAGLHLPATCGAAQLSPDGLSFLTTDIVDNIHANNLRVWDTATATLRYTHPAKSLGVLSPDGRWLVYAKPLGVNQLQLLDVPANHLTDMVANYFGPTFPFLMFTPDSKSFWLQRNHEFIRYEIQALPDVVPILVEKQHVLLKDANDFQRIPIIYPSADGKTFLVELGVPNALVKTRKVYASADGKELDKKEPGLASSFLRLRQLGNQMAVEDFLNGKMDVFGQQKPLMNFHALDGQHKYAATTQTGGKDASIRINLWDVPARRPLLTLADLQTKSASALRFSADAKYLTLVTNDGWTRIMPMDWLLQRKALLPCQPLDVAAP